MGEREVVVGCPHRLRQFIGRRTATPCAACAPFGPPGWPRLAIALTVDYGPRLSRAAVEAPFIPATPPLPAMKALGDALATVAERMGHVIAHPTLVERMAGLTIEHGPVNVVMHEQSETDRMANVIRFEATQAMRLRER